MSMVNGWDKVAYVGALFLILMLIGEGLFRGNERQYLSLMTDKKYSFYSNSNDVFTVLRIVNAMDDDKTILIGTPPKDTNFDQLFILNGQNDQKYPINDPSNNLYTSKQLVLRKFNTVGTLYLKDL